MTKRTADILASVVVMVGLVAVALSLAASPVQVVDAVNKSAPSTVLNVLAYEITCSTSTATHITSGSAQNKIMLRLDKDETGTVWLGSGGAGATATAAAGFWISAGDVIEMEGRGLYCLADGASPIDIRVLGGD